MKYTKGPWVLSNITDYTIDSIAGIPICKYFVSKTTETQDLANASLISAAPEMLEVLIALRYEILSHGNNGDMVNLRMIENVIFKAQGEI